MKVIIILLTMLVSTSAFAFGKQTTNVHNPQYQNQQSYQQQGQAQGQIGINKSTNYNNNQNSNKAYGGNAKAYGGNSKSYSDSNSYSKSGAAAGAASKSGASVNIENTEVHPDDIEIRQLGTIYNNPNNNTASCLKVWGIATGTKDAQGALGVPFESTNCNVDLAARDAFAQGNYELGWWWSCHNSKRLKFFKGGTREERVEKCAAKMMEMSVFKQGVPQKNAVSNINIPQNNNKVREDINLVEEFSTK